MSSKSAHVALNLELTEQDSSQRYALSGGTARDTPTNDNVFTQRGVRAVNEALSKISSVGHV